MLEQPPEKYSSRAKKRRALTRLCWASERRGDKAACQISVSISRITKNYYQCLSSLSDSLRLIRCHGPKCTFRYSPMATMHEASTPQIKLESGLLLANNEESLSRSEHGYVGTSPAGLSDADIYEDTGDLDFARAAQAAYLTRIPKFLWENWSKIEDDQEIVLGTVRVEGTVTDVKRVRFHLLPAVDLR